MLFRRKVQAKSMAMTPPVMANNIAASLADVSHLSCQKAQQITLRIAKVRRIFKTAFSTVSILSVDFFSVRSGMLSLVLFQEVHQRLHALLGHGVVDGGPETADALVALQIVKSIKKRSSCRTAAVKNLLRPRKSYRTAAFSSLRCAMASNPPLASRYWNTLPQQ